MDVDKLDFSDCHGGFFLPHLGFLVDCSIVCGGPVHTFPGGN